MKKHIILLTLFFLVWRVALFALSYHADSFLPYHPSFPIYVGEFNTEVIPRWFYSWANFDGVHYTTIAVYGYIGTGLIQAFFPFFPFVILHTVYQFFPPFAPNAVFLGVIFSNLFAYLLIFLWFYFVAQLYDKKVAWAAVLMLFLFPTSFFFGAVYTESLFLLLVIGSFFAARKKWWFLASVLAMLATATRIVGIFVVPALLIELWQQEHGPLKKMSVKKYQAELILFWRKKWQEILMILAGSFGLFAYMFFLTLEFHDPFYFFHIQSSFGGGRGSAMVLYPQVWFRYIKILLTARPFDLKYYSYVQEFLFSIFGLVVIVYSFWKTRLSYAFFSLCAFLLPTFTGTFSSLPRYTIVSFSLFLCLAPLFAKKRRLFLCYLLFTTAVLILNTVLFIQGYWVA